MKQYLILLAVVALAIPTGCDRSSVEDEREFNPQIDGLNLRDRGPGLPLALGADQTAIATAERNRIAASMIPVVKSKPKPTDITGLKPMAGTDAGATTKPAGTDGTKTGDAAAGTATGAPLDDTGLKPAGTGAAGGTDTGKTGTKTGTGGGSAIDGILEKP